MSSNDAELNVEDTLSRQSSLQDESAIIKDLQERLQFANETIQTMLEEQTPAQTSSTLDEPMQQFEAQISGLEQQRSVLIDEIQSTKDKAHSMLAGKDTEVSQLRNVIAKLKSLLVTKTEITPEEMQDLLNAQIAP